MKRRHTHLTGPPNALAGWALLAIANFGVLFLLGLTKPASIARSLDPMFQVVWALLMAVGGITALAGMYWPGREFTGARVKIAGLIGAGGGAAAYGAGLLLLNGSAGRGTGFWAVLVGVSCLHRALQVSRILRERMLEAQMIDRRRRR